MAMMNALTSAVSGMTSSQTGLDVIANNISNVNTPGYKSQTVSFSDLLSQTISAASGATATTGGTNPSQVGLGTQVSSIDADMTVGTASTTSKSTDVALTGDGYFIVQTTTKGDYEYARAGNLSIDEDGNLNIDGYEVCGWEAYTLDADGNKVYTTTGAVEPINVKSDAYSGSKNVMAAKTTTEADVSGYLSSSADVVSGATLKNVGSSKISDWDATTTVDVIDEQGNKTEVTLNLKKCATQNSTTSWYWEASATDSTISPSSGYIAFDSTGKTVTSATPLTATITSNTSTSTPAQTTFANAVTTAGDTTVSADYAAYAAALTSGNASTIASTKTALDNAISALGNATLTAALTTYNSAAGTVINTDATALTTAITNAATAQTTFAAAVTAAGDATVSADYTAYAAALTSGDAATIVSTKATLDSAISALGNATLSAALTTYNSAAGTTINTDAAALTTAITNASTATTGYSASNISVTSGLAAGNYTVNVAAATSGSGYTVTLTDPSGKTYTTTSTDGSATFKTSSGTVSLTAPTTIAAGTAVFSVAAGTAVTFDSTPTITVASTTNGTNAVPVKLDFSGVTSTGTSTSKLTVDEDGYEAGTQTGSYSISKDGTISASYSNGKTQSIGQIALAVFQNANGLEKVGGNLYKTTTNSGDFSYVVAGQDGSGTMQSYALELSNVDLASQFSSMMISQRAYQANTKVISTASDMLQSLINMVG